ncbi:MAG: M48 family metalloprotease [Thermoactinospora sp.]|nr:M48 family metalloprotease [Thermoactinospora sp.]
MTVAVATPPPVPGPRRSGESVPEQRERPARLPPARAWLAGVLTRDVRSTASGVICAWFGVPWVLLMAAFGAVLGGIVGLVNGTMVGPGVLDRMDKIVGYVVPLPVKPLELLPTAAAQIGGIVAALIGAVSGGWKLGYMAATWPWEALYEGDPTWPWMVAVGQVVTALFVGALWVLGSSATEGLRLRIGGCRRMSRRERLWLAPLVAECARRLDITRPPVLLIHDRREPNAYALTRHVVINQGLLDDLGYDPVMVGGVVTHELAHWQEGHAISAAWAKGVALPLYLLYEIAVRLIDVTGRIRPLQWLLRVLLWSVTTTVRGIVIPIHAHTARANELAADDRVIEAGYAEGFRRALARLRFYEQGRDGWDRAVCATHPPIELRMERLESPGRRYPLRDDYALSAGLLGAPTSTVRRTE